MSLLSFFASLLAWSSASAWDVYCPCSTPIATWPIGFLQQVPIQPPLQPYYNQPLGPFFETNPAPLQFMGNGPPTVAPQAAAPAAASPPGVAAGPPLGPTPECPCMTTPNPNTTPQPGSPEDAKKDIHKSMEDLSKEKNKEVKEQVGKSGDEEIAEVKKLSDEAKASANGKLAKVSRQEFDIVSANYREQADRDELKLDSLRNHAVQEGTADAESVTQATEDVADLKAKTVVGQVMDSTKAEIKESQQRALEITKKTRGMVHEANLSAERVENAAKEAQMAALKEPRHRAAEAQRQSIKAGEDVMALQPDALQSQKIAEAAAAVAWEAQKTANKALQDAKLAVKASESAYQDALTNKANLVKLKERANQATKEIKTAKTSAANAVQAATGVTLDVKALGLNT